MTLRIALLSVASLLFASHGLADDGPFSFCKDNKCQDCPVSIAKAGTGFPECVVYRSSDVFPGLGYEGSASGGYEAYLDVDTPGDGCATIVRSPAGVDIQNCGYPVGSYKHATCSAPLDIDTTFMVQFCCGHGDCSAAGAEKVSGTSAKFKGLQQNGGSGSGGVYLKGKDGKMIMPIEVGVPTTLSARQKAAMALERRDVDCDDWTKEGDLYTKLSSNTQVVSRHVRGPTDVAISSSRSQSYTQTTGFDFGLVGNFASFGASISNSFTKEKTDTTTYTFTVPDSKEGVVGFTPILLCSKGHTTCGDDSVSGEICWPQASPDNDDALDGIYAVISQN